MVMWHAVCARWTVQADFRISMNGQKFSATMAKFNSMMRTAAGTDVSEDSTVSMNFWGYTPSIFDEIESRFPAFLSTLKQPLKDEFLLPTVVSELITDGVCEVFVLPTMAKWHGVTYHEDKAKVQNFIRNCIENHEYPGGLWK